MTLQTINGSGMLLSLLYTFHNAENHMQCAIRITVDEKHKLYYGKWDFGSASKRTMTFRLANVNYVYGGSTALFPELYNAWDSFVAIRSYDNTVFLPCPLRFDSKLQIEAGAAAESDIISSDDSIYVNLLTEYILD